MDFISLYQQNGKTPLQNNMMFRRRQQTIYSEQAIYKLISTLQRFKHLSFTLLSPELNFRSKIVGVCDKISFGLVHDSTVLEFQYFFNVQINLQNNVIKILATLIRQGKPYKVHKEGLVQLLSNFFLNLNSISNYSLRVHPFTGIIKFGYVNHLSSDKIAEMFIFPVQCYENIKNIIAEMVLRLNERILGKILHLCNQIPLKCIIPESFDTTLSDQNIESIKKLSSTNPLFPEGTMVFHWTLNKKLKQLRKYIANSTIKYSFISKDHQNDTHRIRFVPQLLTRKREPQKQQKMAKHNLKFVSFSKQVKDILHYYTPISRLNQQELPYGFIDNSWLEPTEEQVKSMREILKCDHVRGRQRTVNSINIESIQSQVPLCSGGFADISRLVVKIGRKAESEQNPQIKNINTIQKINKLHMIKKCAGKEKLFWQKNILKQIATSSCIFINKYYDPKIDVNSVNLTQKMLDDSIFMQYCPERSLNHYLAKMNSILSIRSKLFILYQICIALRFLRDHGITHLDVKPQNVLVKMATSANSALVIVKIIDYGQAYCQHLIGSKINRGHTCPYAPPELVMKHSQGKFTQKSDVFSLGVMILIIIFQLNTVDIKRLTSSVIYETNQRYMRFYSMCIEKCRYLYYQPLLQCLMNLAYKCINPNPSSRPYLNWICVILRTMISTFDQIQKTKY